MMLRHGRTEIHLKDLSGKSPLDYAEEYTRKRNNAVVASCVEVWKR
jgi:hypothetical protein